MPNQHKAKREAISVVGPSIAYIPCTKGAFTLVDSEMVAELCKFNWSFHPDTGYVFRKQNGRLVYLHRYILGGESSVVDHKNNEPLHNFRGNLRAADRSQNQHNRKMNSNNTTGVKGCTREGRFYIVTLKKNYIKYVIGRYSSLEEAREASDNAYRLIHGIFHRTS